MKAKDLSIDLRLIVIAVFCTIAKGHAQVTLGASPYTEDFNGISSGLPVGWTVRANATASGLGSASSMVTTATAWNSATGNFRNVAAAAGLNTGSSTASQGTSMNRALGVRQTGTLGDPGASFVLQLSNTIGLKDFSLSFKLQSLDGSATGRTVAWRVDYGFGNAPASFSAISTSPSTLTTTLSAAGWGSTDVTADFGALLNNNGGNVWIRIVTLTTATGSSSRPTSAIDDFQLSFSSGDFTPPSFGLDYPKTSNVSATGFDLLTELSEAGKTFFVVLPDGATAPAPSQIKGGQDANDNVLPQGFQGAITVSAASIEMASTLMLLNSDTDYDVFVVAEDDAHNIQASVVKLDVRTSVFVDVIPPDFLSSYPIINSIFQTGFNIRASLDELGKVYFVVLPEGSPTPVPTQVRNGQDGSGGSLNGNLVGTVDMVIAGTEYSAKVGGLSPDTAYDVYVVAEDNSNNLQTSPTKLTVTTIPLSVKANQSIVFAAPATKTFGDAPFNLLATASSGLEVSFSSSDPAIATISGSTVTILKAGSVVITASQDGDENFDHAVEVQRTLEITKTSQVITMAPLAEKTFGDPSFSIASAGGSSGLPVTFLSSNAAVASVSGNLVTIVGAGSTVITASQSGDENFEAAVNVLRTLEVIKANQAIVFSPLAPGAFGAPPIIIAATGGNSGMPLTFSSSNPSVATVSENSITIVGVGSAVIKATQPGNENFSSASDVTQTLTITKANQVITFSSLPVKSFGDAPFELIASGGGSGLPVSYISSKPSVATITGTTVTIVGPGTAKITASQAGTSNYNAAEDVSQTLTVNKGSQSIVFNSLAPRTFGDAPFNLISVGGTSGLPVTYTSSKSSVATISGNTVTIIAAGTSTITAKQAGNGNYNAATDVVQTLTINKATQSISFNSLPSKSFGEAPFVLAAAGGSSGLPVTFVSSNTNVATVNGSLLTIVGASSATITAKQAGNANYAAATDVTQTLTVAKGSQSITFDALPSKTFGDASFSLVAKGGGSALPVAFISSNTSVATLNGSTVSIVGVGTTTIIASQSGNGNYNPAVNIAQMLTVTKANQAIVFPTIGDKTLGDPAFVPVTTTNSNLAVSYSTTSDKIAINGNQITLMKAGRVTLTANQAGNGFFNAAQSVTQGFCVKPAIPLIAISQDNPEAVTLSSGSASGNQWYLDGSLIGEGINSTLDAVEPGLYKLQVNVDDCFSDFSAEVPIVVTGDLPVGFVKIEAYPNPAENYLELRGLKEVVGAKVMDLTGCSQSITLEKREWTYRADVGNLSQGVYLLIVADGKKVHHIKFVRK